jgi:uncharacterized protein (TIGR02145 family)
MKKIIFFLLLLVSAQAGCTLTDPEVMEMLKALQAQNDKLLEEITSMKGQLTGLDGKYQAILTGLADNKKDLEALKGQVEALKTQIADQLKKIDQLNAQLTQQGADVVKLSAELVVVKASLADLIKKFEELIIQGSLGNGTVKDVDGNIYKIVKIGNQIWMAENLKTTKFSNGELIPVYPDRFVWEWVNFGNGQLRTTPAQCYYNNDSGFNAIFGKLYNWYTATDSRNVCPQGWRVSTDQDWTILQEFLGENPGDKLKKIGTDEWNFPNSGAKDEFGFSAVPTGVRDNEGFFNGIGINSFFWTPSNSIAFFRIISLNNPSIVRSTRSKTNGLCIRCIKN